MAYHLPVMDPTKYRNTLLRLVRIRQTQAIILHYDPASNGLRPWLWCVSIRSGVLTPDPATSSHLTA